MKLQIGELITLDDYSEYICLNTIEKDNDNYIYLMSTTKPIHFIFAKEIIDGEDITIEIVDNNELKKELFAFLQSQTK